MRAVVDTNVWISAILNPAGPPAAIRTALQQGRFMLVSSEPLLAELVRVLARPRFAERYGITPTDVGTLTALLRERAEIVPVSGDLHLCRDPDDDLVIETALAGGAAALVTRDDDLKAASEITAALSERGVAVLTVRHFLAAIQGESPG